MEQVIRSTSSIDANLAASLIRESKSAAFRNKAIGFAGAIGITSLALSLGAAAILWAHNQRVDPEMLTRTNPAQPQPPIVLPTPKPEENQAIKTTVTVFKTLPYGDGDVVSGWKFASGDAKSPSEQYCYYLQKAGEGTNTQQHIAINGVISFAAPVAPAEQAARFHKCQWWQGGSV